MANDPIFVDFSDETGEERWYALGATDSLRILFLVLTIRRDRFRPIIYGRLRQEIEGSLLSRKRQVTYHNGQKDETGYSKIHLGRRGCSVA